MGLRGHVASMALEEVLSFLGANALDGTLAVTSGEEASLRLHFHEGRVFFPFSSRKGTYSLGKLLRHTGVLSRESLETYLGAARREKAALLSSAADGPQVEEARRRQTTEEIHDLFLWGDAHFEFLPGPMPPRVAQDYEAARGLILDIQGLLMEVAHRADERRRIRAVLPSSRVVLRTAPGREAEVVKALAAERIDVQASPFDGEARVDDLLVRWGVPHHDALRAIGLLVEGGKVIVLPPIEARAKAAVKIGTGELAVAGRYLGHVLEVAPDEPGPTLELDLISSPAFAGGPEAAISLRLPGRRAFALVRALLEKGDPFTFVLRASMRELRLSALPGEVSVVGAEVELEDVLVGQSALSARALVEAKAAASASARTVAGPGASLPIDLSALVTPEAFEEARRELVAHALVEAAMWGASDVELRNRHQLRPGAHTVALTPEGRAKLVASLGRWAKTLERVPGEDAILVPGARLARGGGAGAADDPAARFFGRFTFAKSLAEVRRDARAKRLDFLGFAARGVERGYLRAPSLDELVSAVEAARGLKNDVAVARLVRAAAAQGLSAALAKEIGATNVLARADAPQPGIEGDLEGIGLAAVLQALRDNRRTGTLVVKAGAREEKLYFHRGDAFILRIEDKDAAAFAEFFLGEEGAEHVEELAENNVRGRVDESALDAAEVREIKAAFLDVLFWEGANFAFFLDELPDAFFAPIEGVSEIALETDRFLLDAIRALTEWDQIRRVIPTGRTLFRFVDSSKKLATIKDKGNAEILMLVDGRKTFDDLVRISGERRLIVGRLFKSLFDEGVLEDAGQGESSTAASAGPPAAAGADPLGFLDG